MKVVYIAPLIVTYGEQKLVLTYSKQGILVWWRGELVANIVNEDRVIQLVHDKTTGDKFMTQVDTVNTVENDSITPSSRRDLVRGFVLSFTNDSRLLPYFSIVIDWYWV